MRLTEHFTFEELTLSNEGTRAGLDNTPPDSLMPNIDRLADQLERVRRAVHNHPLIITSGYRSAAVNRLIGGARNSLHTKGLAADIICPGFGYPLTVCQAILDAGIEFDELIHEGRWCHFAIPQNPEKPLRKILTAHFRVGQATHYSPGLLA